MIPSNIVFVIQYKKQILLAVTNKQMAKIFIFIAEYNAEIELILKTNKFTIFNWHFHLWFFKTFSKIEVVKVFLYLNFFFFWLLLP